MIEKIARAEAKAVGKALQRCIDPACGATYDLHERVYVCARCGGTLEIDCDMVSAGDPAALRKLWASRAASRDPRDASGVWRYRELLPFDESIPFVTLFEGNTPLYDGPRSAQYCGLQNLRLKHQGCNPTGSFKDAGMTTAVTQAVVLGARTAICASTGNTAASLAAYAARAGLQAAILLPRGQVSSSKLAQSLDYGALVCEIDGNFDDCMRLIQELGDDPAIYVANSINPFRIEGQKTVAFGIDGAMPVAGAGSCGGSWRKHGKQHCTWKRISGNAGTRPDRSPASAERDSGGGFCSGREIVREFK